MIGLVEWGGHDQAHIVYRQRELQQQITFVIFDIDVFISRPTQGHPTRTQDTTFCCLHFVLADDNRRAKHRRSTIAVTRG